jgi:hypothetical protein
VRDRHAVNEMAMSTIDNFAVASAWIGKGELNSSKANGEECTRSRRIGSSQGFVTTFLLSERSRGPR